MDIYQYNPLRGGAIQIISAAKWVGWVVFFTFCLSFGNCASAAETRLVSLAPNITEIAYFLGAGERLVGRTNADNYPLAAQSVEEVGSYVNPSIEKIVSLKPTCIIGCGVPRHPVSVQLESMGYSVVNYRDRTLDDIFYMISDMGARLGIDTAGRIKLLKNRIADLNKKIVKKRSTVLVVFWLDPVLTIGNSSFISEIIDKSGGRNIFADVQKKYINVTTEEIIRRDPDVILLLTMSKEQNILEKNPVLLDFIKAANVRVIDGLNPDIFLRPGPRVVEAMEQLQRELL